MNTTSTQYRNRLPSRRRRHGRRGAIVGILVVALVVIVGLVAMTWGVANLSLAREQMHSACQAAALAGAAELMDEDVLYGRPNSSDDVFAARGASLAYTNANPVNGQPTPLDLNFGNDPNGDVVVGHVVNPRWVHVPMEVASAQGPANSVWVRASRHRLRGNPVSLWLGGLLGVSHGDVAAAARASIDHRVYGFRPESNTSLPLLPLAATGQSWLDQAGAAAVAGDNDNYTVDYRKGYVFDGGDGIPEIVLRAELTGGQASSSGDDATTARFASLVLCNAGFDESVRQREVTGGLWRDDLSQLGGEFSLQPDGTLSLPAVENFAPSWCDALWSLRGAIRVWPLGSATTLANAHTGYQVTGFGAAVIVSTRIDESVEPAQLVVTLQPAVLATSTALSRDNAAENPWIAKLSLTQ